VQPFWLKRATPQTYSTAFRVALIIGSVLFLKNHGEALIKGKMNRTRWVSAVLTYCVPFGVSLHGQCQRNTDRNDMQ
jgi:hypothetical protein